MSYHPSGADDRAGAQECIDRAQRVLELAELNLDTVSTLLNHNKERATFADLIAHAEARTRLGMAWAGLAEIKAMRITSRPPRPVSEPTT